MLFRPHLLCLTAIATLLFLSHPVAGLTGARLDSATESEVVVTLDIGPLESTPVEGTEWVRVTLPGYGRMSTIGAPALPTGGFSLAMPPGATARLTVLEVEEYPAIPGSPVPTPSEEIHLDAQGMPVYDLQWEPAPWAYAGPGLYPIDWASLGDPAGARHQRILPIQITPVRWDPDAKVFRSARKIRLRVEFLQAADAREPAGMRPIPPEGAWERSYQRQILNYEQGKRWRRGPVASLPPMLKRRAGVQAKLTVAATGLLRVPFNVLTNAGLAENSIPWDELVLVEGLFEDADLENPLRENAIPYLREDGDEDGFFEPGESIIFFGQDRWDRFNLPDRQTRYGRDNHYFLRWTGGGDPGATMGDSLSWQGWESLTPPASVTMTQVAEKDSIYAKFLAADDDDSQLYLATEMLVRSHFYWSDFRWGTQWTFFKIPQGAQFRQMVVDLQGYAKISGSNYHKPSLYLSNRPRGARPWTSFPGNPYSVREKRHLTITLNETNLSGFEPVYEPDSIGLVIELPLDGYGISLDRVTMTYTLPFTASLGSFTFHTGGLTGPQEFQIGGFTSDDILAFEVTDSVLVTHLPLSDDQIIPVGGGYQVSLQLNAGDGSTPRVIKLVERNRIASIKNQRVAIREIHDLTGTGSEDYLVIYHNDFTSTIEPLLQHRESLGHQVIRADVEDVYDNFDGGRKSPYAIRNYLRYLFRTRTQPPVYLLLVGDASDDCANVTDFSDFNFIPTMTLPSTARGDNGSELVSNDTWYVDNLTGTGEHLDFYFDIHLGRLPAGSPNELETMVSKIIRYEDFQPGDFWRNRGVFMADDQYSGDSPDSYIYRGYESVFESGTLDCIRHIYDSAELLDFEVDTFFVSGFLDTLRTTARCHKDTSGIAGDPCDLALLNEPCFRYENGTIEHCQRPPQIRSQNAGGSIVIGALIESLSRGALIWNVESHANAVVITHEDVFMNLHSGRQDVPLIQNRNKPFLFFGFGCHLAEFSNYLEGRSGFGDCISEKLLFHGNPGLSLGAVGSLASTGYEWLTDNDLLNTALFEAFFADVPQIDGESTWIFGDILTHGKAILMDRNYTDPTNRGQVMTYTYLGDPALRVDIAAPRLNVEVDGGPVETGTPVKAPSPDDSIHVDLRVLDEVALRGLSVVDIGGTLPMERITITPDPARPDDDRVYRAAFALKLRPDDYAITIQASDRMGRQRTFTLSVALDVSFFVSSGDTETPLLNNDFLPSGSRIIVHINSPVFLDETAFTAMAPAIDDIPWGYAVEASGEIVQGESREWKLITEPIDGLEEGGHTLAVGVEGVSKSIRFVTDPPGENLRVVRLFNFPNPFEEGTEFHYVLNRDGDRASIKIYTLRGRLIQTLDPLSAHVNDNIVVWDGRDGDGDQISNGVYFYKFQVWDTAGKKISLTERIVRAR
ncbi:MAG: hypothetical protein KJ970_02235 [Candidatus Eisenbacteria bacterium]|uniref:Gingipain domain-containing protein n=1 Tax=Eiseniibacteriota bacterium TaxID=2212470 RepID=A0A948RTI3_UNCEI|nr:hypothetical protein [Candidatus Eisenbacteria bacterium]MBU2689716.1 hypothetical protein [Candidatus Eisenbacteria bacterium]